MDLFKKFNIEYPGIRENIKEYTSEGGISNIISQMDKAINEKDLELIQYLLGRILDWYKENQSKIQNNQFVYNKSVHIKNQNRLIEFADDFREYKMESDNDLIKNKDTTSSYVEKKFFISHSSQDKLICKAFVSLLESIGVPESDILFTSSDRHGVPGGEDIFEYLSHYLRTGITVFYMLSDNYYNSPYCLNEMGAAWVVKNDFSIFLLPNLTVGIKGVVDKNRKGYELTSVFNLIEIRDMITSIYGSKISEGKWEEVKKNFIDSLNG